MTKNQFLAELKRHISVMPSDDVAASLEYYAEMIEEYMEEGLSEEEAVARIGSPADIAANALGDIPVTKLVKEKIKPKRSLRAWEITLLVLGAPLWLSLIIAAAAVVLALYVSFWSVVAAFWSVGISIIASAVACLASGFALCFIAWNTGAGIFLFGAAMFLSGLGIFGIWGCKALTRVMLKLGKLIIKEIKNCFIKKEVIK